MIREYLAGGYTKQGIWQKYTGQPTEHGKMLSWMRKLGYIDAKVAEKGIALPNQTPVPLVEDTEDMSPDRLRARSRNSKNSLNRPSYRPRATT